MQLDLDLFQRISGASMLGSAQTDRPIRRDQCFGIALLVGQRLREVVERDGGFGVIESRLAVGIFGAL